LTGGRKRGYFAETGFQSGVHFISKPGEARDYATQMIGKTLVTPQAPKGIRCSKVLLMERMYLKREMYVSILMDRASQGPLMIVSPRGGGPMGQIARLTPELIYTEPIDIVDGLDEDQCHRMAYFLGLEQDTPGSAQATRLMMHLYDMFISCDCTQVEINPLAETTDGDIVACDAKVHFDDNSAYRQASIFEKRDKTQEDPREVEAAEYGLNYVGMDGNIGCMVNGGMLTNKTVTYQKAF
jgi:succinyl-CoA synthetase beta subunit